MPYPYNDMMFPRNLPQTTIPAGYLKDVVPMIRPKYLQNIINERSKEGISPEIVAYQTPLKNIQLDQIMENNKPEANNTNKLNTIGIQKSKPVFDSGISNKENIQSILLGSTQIKNTEIPTLREMPPTIYNDILKSATDQYGVPYQLGYNLLKAESNFNPNAVSPTGAQGIAQFMPSTAKDVGINPMDPNEAIPGAMKYLKTQYDKFGSWPLALAAYNAGPGNVSKYGTIPPFKETQDYVANIMGDYTETTNRMKLPLSSPTYLNSEIPMSGLLRAKNPVDVNSPDYIPDRTVILGGKMTTTDYGAGLAYDQNGNLVPGMSPDRIREFVSGNKLVSDSDQLAREPYLRGQEFVREKSLQELKNLGQLQAVQASANNKIPQAQKRFSDVRYDDLGNTKDYDVLTGESRTNGIYDKFRRPTIDIAENNPELSAQNLSNLNKTNPEIADQILNEMAQQDIKVFQKIMDILKRFK